MDKTLKEKNDAWTDTDEHTEIPFRKRVQNFWKWFTDNEKKLSQIVENRGKSDSENAVEFITAGTDLINKEVHFNLGGDYDLLSLSKGIPPVLSLSLRCVTVARAIQGQMALLPFQPRY